MPGNDSLIVLRLYGWSTGNGINLLQGFELSFLIRSYSLNVNQSLLCSNDGSESLVSYIDMTSISEVNSDLNVNA